ncbi:MAG: ATP-binding protein [Gammaproteobacteria bacterium]
MSLLTIAWSFCASVCLMLGSIHLLFWFRKRSSPVYLLSSLMAFSAGANAMLELGLLHTESLDHYRVLMLWENVAVFMILVPMVWFIQAYFATGRRWLAITITLLWILGLLANFLSPHSLTFIEVSELQRLTTPWGEAFTIPLGTGNPWKLLADCASLLILVYVGDAAVRLWRQGGQRTATVIGGGIIFFILLAGIHSPLVDAGIIATPYMVSFAFLAIIVSMSYQLAEDAMRSAQYARELQQSQQAVERLARANLLGELTSTLAHELNQPLSAILSNAEAGRRLLVSGPAKLADIGDILDDIVRDDQRAADIIQRLRNLLQAGEAVREPLDINAVLQEAIALLSGELSQQQVTPTLEFGKHIPDVLAGRTEIQQVAINLITNALNALRDTPVDQRQLVIRTSRHNDTVMVTVRDNGRGIAEDDLPRLFEAFFSRKSDGLGMGLAIARRIVEAYGGRVLAASSATGGATFTFTLPMAPGEQGAGHA